MNLFKLFSRLSQEEEPTRTVVKSDEEWRARLSPAQYRVLRRKATEAPFTGKYVHPDGHGTYECAACGALLFSTTAQFDSRTGWPSFTEPAETLAVERRRDRAFGMARTEVLCRSCGGHLGHVFNDGPAPDGQRYCINSAALELRGSSS